MPSFEPWPEELKRVLDCLEPDDAESGLQPSPNRALSGIARGLNEAQMQSLKELQGHLFSFPFPPGGETVYARLVKTEQRSIGHYQGLGAPTRILRVTIIFELIQPGKEIGE